MEITSVQICNTTAQVTIKVSNSATALTAKCLGIVEQTTSGEPKHIVLDRLLFTASESDKLSGRWTSSGSYVTELKLRH